jgi:hypothetical protein
MAECSIALANQVIIKPSSISDAPQPCDFLDLAKRFRPFAGVGAAIGKKVWAGHVVEVLASGLLLG